MESEASSSFWNQIRPATRSIGSQRVTNQFAKRCTIPTEIYFASWLLRQAQSTRPHTQRERTKFIIHIKMPYRNIAKMRMMIGWVSGHPPFGPFEIFVSSSWAVMATIQLHNSKANFSQTKLNIEMNGAELLGCWAAGIPEAFYVPRLFVFFFAARFYRRKYWWIFEVFAIKFTKGRGVEGFLIIFFPEIILTPHVRLKTENRVRTASF